LVERFERLTGQMRSLKDALGKKQLRQAVGPLSDEKQVF
jgi:hypothetical protein